MEYAKLTKEQLIEIIEELQILNQHLFSECEKQCGFDFAWGVNSGHWHWNIKADKIIFNSLITTLLGYSKEDIPEKVTYQIFTGSLHPEDYQKTMDIIVECLDGKTDAFETKFRIRTKSGNYKRFYSQGKVTQYDEQGRPIFLTGIMSEVKEKKEDEIETAQESNILSEQASTDSLTQTRNYRSMVVRLSAEAAHAGNQLKSFSLAMIDIDDLKKINGSKGRVFGNKVLIDIASIIRNNLSAADILGRFGGDEFMIIFPKKKLEEAGAVIKRIRQSVERYSFNNRAKITVSCSIKEYHGEEPPELIGALYIDLYKSKMRGKSMII